MRAFRRAASICVLALMALAGRTRAQAPAQPLAPRQILSSTEADDRAFVTPDGRTMALADWSSGDIGLMDLATHKMHRLMAKQGQWESDDFASMPVPSPDLSQVAFLWYQGGANPDLRVIANRAGAKPRSLVHNSEFAYVLPAAWSPAGDAILVVLWKHDYTAQIAWVSAADGSIRVLRSLDWRRPGRVSLSPDGRYIAYSCLKGADSVDSHVYVLASDGSSEAEIVKDAGVNEAPVWTPDGSRLLFVSDRQGSMDLWSVEVTRGKAARAPVRVQAGIGRIIPLGMTRAGSLYYVKEHGTENVVVANLSGEGGSLAGQPFLLTDNFAGRNRGPAWSPDGRSVAFKRRSETNRAGYDLVVRALTTGDEKTYGSNSLAGSTSRPAWFPDGASVLTAMADNQNRISFQRVDLKTGEFSEAVAAEPEFLAIHALAPDGKTVYIATGDDGKNRGGVVAVDLRTGSEKLVFTTPGFVNNFALSPDGRELAIARSVSRGVGWEGRLSVVVVTGGAAAGAESDVRDVYTSAQSAPGEDIFGGGPMVAWTPDGREILFGAGAREWRVMRVPAAGGEARFTGLVTTGLRHDVVADPNADAKSVRIAFSDGKSGLREAWALDGIPVGGAAVPAAAPVSKSAVAAPPAGLDAYMPTVDTSQVALGKKLFFDTRLSRDGTVACSTCHDPEHAFSDGRTVARGVGGSEGVRNSPSIVNRGYGASFFWDGRAATLEAQALEPILNPKELGLTEPEIEGKTGLNPAEVTAALASFVRTIRSGDSRYDRYTLTGAGGGSGALTDLEKAGLALFRGKGRCVDCHVGPNFTDEQFHNTGVAWQIGQAGREGRFTDQGRATATGQERDRGTFKTPTLRNVALTAPYMHDGSLATLEDVVEFYSQGGRVNPNLDHDIRPRRFTEEEKRALAAFLRALTGRIEYGEVARPAGQNK